MYSLPFTWEKASQNGFVILIIGVTVNTGPLSRVGYTLGAVHKWRHPLSHSYALSHKYLCHKKTKPPSPSLCGVIYEWSLKGLFFEGNPSGILKGNTVNQIGLMCCEQRNNDEHNPFFFHLCCNINCNTLLWFFSNLAQPLCCKYSK